MRQLPTFHRETIPPAYLDIMGHMNVRHYIGIFDTAAWYFFAAVGMDESYYREYHAGGFALQQFIRYLAEVRVEETPVTGTFKLLKIAPISISIYEFEIQGTPAR